MNRLFIDTNVLVYALDKDSVFYKKARTLLFDKPFDLFTSTKNLSEFLAVVTRKGAIQLAMRDALSILKQYLKILSVLYPNPDTVSLFQELLAKYHPTGLRIYDYEIASIALANQIHQLATFNEKDFANIKSLKIVSV